MTTSDDDGKRAFSTSEVAEMLDVHVETVRRWIRNDELPAAKFGRNWKVSAPDLNEFWRERGGGKLVEVTGKTGGHDVLEEIKSEREAAGDDWKPTREQVESLAEYTAPRTYEALSDIPHLEWEDNSPRQGDWEAFQEAFGDAVSLESEAAAWFIDAYEQKFEELTDDDE